MSSIPYDKSYVTANLVSYTARLPEISTALCQKLGGPKPPSPPRPMLRKAATASQIISNPSTAVRRQQMRRPRRTLERVLTEERSASRNPPSLSRSTTDSVLPRLKREVSEGSMSSIPITNVSISKSRRYSQREVDLCSISQAKEAKIKKKASVEQELKGAIDTLKRPNPRMAVKELVEAADRRTGVSNWRSKCSFISRRTIPLRMCRAKKSSSQPLRSGRAGHGDAARKQKEECFRWFIISSTLLQRTSARDRICPAVECSQRDFINS